MWPPKRLICVPCSQRPRLPRGTRRGDPVHQVAALARLSLLTRPLMASFGLTGFVSRRGHRLHCWYFSQCPPDFVAVTSSRLGTRPRACCGAESAAHEGILAKRKSLVNSETQIKWAKKSRPKAAAMSHLGGALHLPGQQYGGDGGQAGPVDDFGGPHVAQLLDEAGLRRLGHGSRRGR